MSDRIGPCFCDCCGERESDSGCVRGPVCRCGMNRYCAFCGKCQDHCKCEKPELYRDQMEARTVRIAKKLGRNEMRSEVESLKDMLSAEQASHNELRRQMDVLAYNYTADERKYKAEIERLRADLNKWQESDHNEYERAEGYMQKAKDAEARALSYAGESDSYRDQLATAMANNKRLRTALEDVIMEPDRYGSREHLNQKVIERMVSIAKVALKEADE